MFNNMYETKKAFITESLFLAEGGGFEPPVQFPAHMFSKHAV